MKKPVEMKAARPMELHDGATATTTDVWATLNAAKDGDLDALKALGDGCTALLRCRYDYTSPIQFAIREGHTEVVRYLIQNGALPRDERNHPFLEPIEELAADRGFSEIVEMLTAATKDPGLMYPRPDTCKIDQGYDDEQVRFQRLVDEGEHNEVESMLKSRSDLALMENAFWGEGVLATAANNGDRPMLELLMSYGATVPKLSKWGARYYFKHYDTAKFLLENGMDPNHMSWREFTLLHDFAFTGDAEKIKLLLDFGADIDALDEEYHSTPLGYAAKWGNREVVNLLLERGADPNKAGVEWATPLAWAAKKGHAEIATDLRHAGAV